MRKIYRSLYTNHGMPTEVIEEVGILVYTTDDGMCFTYLNQHEICKAIQIMEEEQPLNSILYSRDDNKYIVRLCNWRIKNKNVRVIYENSKFNFSSI